MNDHPRSRRFRSRRGYTTIEVLIAMTVFAIGAAGVIGMQKAAVQGNMDARRMDVANNLAREWVERLRRDALFWTVPADLSKTTFLKDYNLAASPTVWTVPGIGPASTACPPAGSVSDGQCPTFDVLGRDVNTSDAPTKTIFCTQIRLTPLVNQSLLRTEVRVFWLRQLNAAPSAGNFCTNANTDADAANAASIFHFVYAASAIRVNSP